MKHIDMFSPQLLALAVAMAFPSAVMADEVQELISPNFSEVGLKVQALSDKGSLAREYTGLKHDDANASLDLKLISRSDEGRWVKVEGRDLGLSTQELKATVEQQGDWSLNLGYDQIPHYSPLTVHTAVQGLGSNTLQLPNNLWGAGATFSDQEWKTERTKTSLSASKVISESLQASFGFRSEDKTGTRLMTSGGNAPPGGFGPAFFATQYMNPEPINANHRQIDAALDYFDQKLQLIATYYGSFYKNNAGNALFVGPASTTGQAFNSTNMSPLSLAPDNHAQEFSLSGGYNWTTDTRTTFNVAKTYAIQNADFISPSLLIPTTAGKPAVLTSRSNLGGELETTNASAAVSSRVSKELSLVGSWAYEDRDDKTPKDTYMIDYAHGNGTTAYTNNPDSQTTNRGKLEATYRIVGGYRLTAGYDRDEKTYKGMEEEGFREKMQEDTYRVALRKTLNDVLNGAILFSTSDRTGSGWGSTPTIYGDHWVAPTQFSDRKRDKAKVSLDWTPMQALNMQFVAEHSLDDYASRSNNMGLDKGTSDHLSIDATYQINDSWKTSAWYSQNSSLIRQNERQNPRSSPFPVSPTNSDNNQTCDGTTAARTCTLWSADLNLRGEAIGAGVEGKLNAKWNVGAQYLYSHEVNQYNISIGSVVAGNPANSPVLKGAGILPDTSYTQGSLHLFGQYAWAKLASLRLDYVLDRRQLDDYTWSQYRYSDGTTVYLNPDQTVQKLAVTMVLAF